MVQSWQDLEASIQAWLKDRQRTTKLAYHRFYDTKSAGNAMPAQPADFLIVMGGDPLLIEAKYSAVHDSLRSCFSNSVKGHQLASARVWNRAGARYKLLFYTKSCNQVEVWDGLYCATQRAAGKPLSLAERTIYPSVSEALEALISA